MLRNTATEWGMLARWFHWVIAALVIGLLAQGWYMTIVPPRAERAVQYGWHAAIGYDLFVLMLARTGWRMVNPTPALPPDSVAWERIAAKLGHLALILVTFAVIVTGWMLAGASRRPLEAKVFGLFTMPQVTDAGQAGWHGSLEAGHGILSYALVVLIVVHVAGALRHHFVKRNNVLRRMVRGAA